jgi:hypothetical protein
VAEKTLAQLYDALTERLSAEGARRLEEALKQVGEM